MMRKKIKRYLTCAARTWRYYQKVPYFGHCAPMLHGIAWRHRQRRKPHYTSYGFTKACLLINGKEIPLNLKGLTLDQAPEETQVVAIPPMSFTAEVTFTRPPIQSKNSHLLAWPDADPRVN